MSSLTRGHGQCSLSTCPPGPVCDGNFSGKPPFTWPCVPQACCPAACALSRAGHAPEGLQRPNPELSTAASTSSSPTHVLGEGEGWQDRHQHPSSLASVLGEEREPAQSPGAKGTACAAARASARRGSESLSDSKEGAAPAPPQGLPLLPLGLSSRA